MATGDSVVNEQAKTLGPYRIAFRFVNGEEWTFMLEDLTHARMMDEFFTRFATPGGPGVLEVTVSDATGMRYRAI
jgi:hypothetical protein